ncbi:Reticulon-domain-containing protein [Xylaria arbuscula]|nr:Reticulon-domain-containing protein [Xylaria arbuscula]
MAEPTYVVMPVRADGSTSQENDRRMASAIEESLHERLHPTTHEPSQGPLKRAIAHQDSLYKYISWEDPVRTVGSYLGLVALMYGVHYLHWGQWLLKMGATGLGVMSVLSFVSRSTKSDLIGRMRPEYKTVPESTLNATLKDVHDFVQYCAIQGQRVLYGEDLRKTFGAFVGFTSLFWLVKVLTPFDLEVLGLSSVYLVPLILSPGDCETAQAAKVHAQELANTASDSAKDALNDTKTKSADVSARSQQAVGELASGAQQGAKNLTSSTQQTMSSATSGTQDTVGDIASKLRQTTWDQLPEKSKARNQPDSRQQASVDLKTKTTPVKVTTDGKTAVADRVADRFDFQRHIDKL